MTLFLKSDRKQLISAVFSASLPKDGSPASSLLKIGAVYHNRSAAPTSPSPEHFHNDGSKIYNWKRVRIDQTVLPDDELRVVSVPWRYPVADIDWTKRILVNEKDYIVVDKPAGIPSHPTTDNFVENVLYLLQDHIGLNQRPMLPNASDGEEIIHEPPLQLYIPQRLDTDTSGLMMIAKNAKTISYLNKLLQKRKLSKLYKALIAYIISPSVTLDSSRLLNTFQSGDILDSFLLRSTRSPKQYLWRLDESMHSINDFQEASMRLVDISMPLVRTLDDWHLWLDEYQTANLALSKSNHSSNVTDALQMWLTNASKCMDQLQLLVLQEVTVELLTGRTHQVRGQLQSLQHHPGVTNATGFGDVNVHIAGDNLYTGRSSSSSSTAVTSATMTGSSRGSPYLALQSYSFATKSSTRSEKDASEKNVCQSIGTSFDFRLPQTWWADLFKTQTTS